MHHSEIANGDRIAFRRNMRANRLTVDVTAIVLRADGYTLIEGYRVVRGNATSVIGKADRNGEYDLAPKLYTLTNNSTLIERI